MYPIVGDRVVARAVHADAVSVIRYIAVRECVAGRIIQVDAIAVVRVCGVVDESVATRRI